MFKDKLEETDGKEIFSLTKLLISIGLTWLASGIVLYFVPDHGTFGDMFGAVNALFSGLAFGTLIYTIFLQRHELSLQREELGLTRNEIKEQKEYLAAQNDVLRTQNFENTFFQLLGLLQQTRDSFTFTPIGASVVGKKAFQYAFDTLKRNFNDAISKGISNGRTKDEVVNIVTTSFFLKNQVDFGHHFRILYNLIKLVDKSNLTDKRFYTNLIRAQITNLEATMLFYDCLSDFGKEKFKPLLEEYALLKVIQPEMLFDKYHYSLYSEKAFK